MALLHGILDALRRKLLALVRGAGHGRIGVDEWFSAAEAQLRAFEVIRSPPWTALAWTLTALGDEPFLLFFVAVGYWAVCRRRFSMAAAMLVVSLLLNAWLKGWIQEPRPELSPLIEADGWSFPSGHAQAAAALWGGLAGTLRRRSAAIALWILAAGVALSRPYLGVHYVHDVAVGFALGALQVAVWAGLRRSLPASRSPSWPGWAGLLVVSTGAVFFAFDASVLDGSVRLLGAGTGLAVGVWAQERRPSEMPAGVLRRIAWVVVGTLGLLLLWKGLSMGYRRAGVHDWLALQYLRYLGAGFWISHGALVVAGRLLPEPSEPQASDVNPAT